MNPEVAIIGIVNLLVLVVLGIGGWSLRQNVEAFSRRLDAISDAQESLAKRAECELRHKAVDDEFVRRSRNYHDLANEMQRMVLMFARVDKRLAVLSVSIAAIARAQNVAIPDDED